MFYAYTQPVPPRVHGAWFSFASENARDLYVSRKPKTRRPCGPPKDLGGFQLASGRLMKLDRDTVHRHTTKTSTVHV